MLDTQNLLDSVCNYISYFFTYSKEYLQVLLYYLKMLYF